MLVRRSPRRRPIGLTPLIDVVFILLIFFMLASSFLDWQAIELRTPAKGEASRDGSIPLVVTILPAGGLMLDGLALDREELGRRLAAAFRRDPAWPVRVRAGEVALQRTVAVLETVSAAGGRDVALLPAGGHGR